MLSQDKITRIFCSIDDFCKEFVPNWENQLITAGEKRLKSLTYLYQRLSQFRYFFIFQLIETSKLFILIMCANSFQMIFQL